jgi:hypothetical protein
LKELRLRAGTLTPLLVPNTARPVPRRVPILRLGLADYAPHGTVANLTMLKPGRNLFEERRAVGRR